MQRPGMIENVLAENPCQSKEGALHWDRQLCLGQWQWTKSGLWRPKKISQGEEGAKGRVRLLRARGSAELGQLRRACSWETEKWELR